jgi:hypothetical protein
MSSYPSLLWSTYKSPSRPLLNTNQRILIWTLAGCQIFPHLLWPRAPPPVRQQRSVRRRSATRCHPQSGPPTSPDATQCPVAWCHPRCPTLPNARDPDVARCHPLSPVATHRLMPSQPVWWVSAAPPSPPPPVSSAIPPAFDLEKMQIEPEKHDTFVRLILCHFGTDVFFFYDMDRSNSWLHFCTKTSHKSPLQN